MDQAQIARRETCSPTFRWALFDTANEAQWNTLGFFRTEKAAKQFAICTGQQLFIIGRRFTAQEVRGSRNM